MSDVSRQTWIDSVKGINPRYINYDILRIAACVGVVAMHVISNYSWSFNGDILRFEILNFPHTLTELAVPCFVMLSGALVLNSECTGDVSKFYKKTVKRLIIPTVVFGIIYSAYNLFTGMTLVQCAKKWIVDSPYYHLWYMYMIIGLYLLAPFIYKIKSRLKHLKLQFLFVIGAFVFSIIMRFAIKLPDILRCFEHVGYFVAEGYIFEAYKKNDSIIKRKGIVILLFIIVFAIMIISNHLFVLQLIKKSASEYYITDYLSPLIVFSAVAVFIAATDLNTDAYRNKAIIIKLSNYTFYIYLIHAGVLDVLNKVLSHLNISLNAITGIPIKIAVTLTVSYVGAMVINSSKRIINK